MKPSFVHRYREYKAQALGEFYHHVGDLLEHEDVQKLDCYTQHFCFSRLKHSMDVAYTSFFLAKLFGWDARSTARGGLLHDLFLYERHGDDSVKVKGHYRGHPKAALENAQKLTALNPVEQNIIRRHMWLLTLTPPRYKEGYIVTFVDKYCAVRELLIGASSLRSMRKAIAGNV